MTDAPNTEATTDNQVIERLPFKVSVTGHSRVYLTGYMGAGKSTIGKRMANRMGYKFYDTDALMVKGFRRPVSEVFEKLGEEKFREAEVQVLQELSRRSNLIISTGGGTLARQETMDIALKTGTVIYLNCDVNLLYERVIFSPKDRPILNEPDTEKVFKDKFYSREQFYNQAHHQVKTGERKTDDVVEDCIRALLELPLLQG